MIARLTSGAVSRGYSDLTSAATPAVSAHAGLVPLTTQYWLPPGPGRAPDAGRGDLYGQIVAGEVRGPTRPAKRRHAHDARIVRRERVRGVTLATGGLRVPRVTRGRHHDDVVRHGVLQRGPHDQTRLVVAEGHADHLGVMLDRIPDRSGQLVLAAARRLSLVRRRPGRPGR